MSFFEDIFLPDVSAIAHLTWDKNAYPAWKINHTERKAADPELWNAVNFVAVQKTLLASEHTNEKKPRFEQETTIEVREFFL